MSEIREIKLEASSDEIDHDLVEAAVLDGNEVEITIIEAGVNRSGLRTYPAQVLKKSADKFSGLKMYVDHDTTRDARKREGMPRSVRDIGGVITESWWDEKSQSIKGRATVVKGWLMEIIKTAPDAMGVSINANARMRPKRVGRKTMAVVENFTKYKSVDFVSVPGAGGKIHKVLESYMEEDLMALDNVNMEDLKEHRPDLLDEIKEGLRDDLKEEITTEVKEAMAKEQETEDTPSEEEIEARVAEAVKEAEEAVDERIAEAVKEREAELKAEHDLERQERENATIVEEELAEAKLPEKSKESIAKSFEGVTYEVKESKDDNDEVITVSPEEQLREAVQARVKERREEIAEAAGSGMIKGMGDTGDGKNAQVETPTHDQLMHNLGLDTTSDNDDKE